MNKPDPRLLDPKLLRRRFDRAAAKFAEADFVHRNTEDGLFERMLPMQIEPKNIVDVGCGGGRSARRLAKRFKGARVVGLDQSGEMLRVSRSSRRWPSRVREVQGDAARLPFANGAVDLVFANLLMPWLNDVPAFFGEVARVLRKDGLFIFSSLGPSTLAELRAAWTDDSPHVLAFADMHNIGDASVQAGLRDPVLDVDALNISYRDADSLFRDLTASGARNSLAARWPALTGRRRFAQFRESLQQNGPLELGLELVFGHAWGGGPPPKAGEFTVAAAGIGRRRR